MSETPGRYTTKRDRAAKQRKSKPMPTTSNITIEELERAVAQLGRSDKGRQAMRDLLALLQNGGIALDSSNQLAVLCLLRGAWGSFSGTTRDLLIEQIHPSESRTP